MIDRVVCGSLELVLTSDPENATQPHISPGSEQLQYVQGEQLPGVCFGTHGPLSQAVLKLEVRAHAPTAARTMLMSLA